MYKDPQELLTVLNNTLKQHNIEMTLGFIIGMLESADVYLNEDIIKKYIEVKKKENFKEQDTNNMSFGQKFIFDFNNLKYEYEPYTLYYYKKTINSLKRRCFKFVKLIESIVNKDTNKEELQRYDITIDSEGNILSTDILRIINPFLYNLKTLIDKTVEANELNTYIYHKINKQILEIEGIKEQDLYPKDELQPSDKKYIPLDVNGYIPYTNKQKIEKENFLSDESGLSVSFIEDMINERSR